MRATFQTTSLLAVGLVAAAVAQPRQGAEKEFSLAISVPREVVRVGSEVTVDISVTNITKHVITIGKMLMEHGTEFEYTLEVRDLKSSLVPYTKHGRALHGVPLKGEEPLSDGDFDGFALEVQPGETLHDAILVSGIYDLSKPGKYTIQVTRSSGNAVVKSNAVTISVTN